MNDWNEDGIQILYKLRDIHNQMIPKFERCTGISQSRLDVLYRLYQVNEMSQSDLQKEVKIDSAAITRHLKQLEIMGMVERRKNPNDHRVTIVSLSDKGRKEILSFWDEKVQFAKSMLKGFSDEDCHTLLQMLMKMQQNITEIEA